MSKNRVEMANKAMKIKIEDPEILLDEQKLRERKDKQILYQKWEKEEQKQIIEREMANNLAQKFSSSKNKQSMIKHYL